MAQQQNGILYLLPNSIGHTDKSVFLPSQVETTILPIRHFIVENIRTTRRYLRLLDASFPIDDCQFFELNKHTPPSALHAMIQPLLNGQDMALVSESGSPAVADPGADIVLLAHEKNISVVPMVGPSSILLALMASGLNGQHFAFNGYLPIDKHQRQRELRTLEQRSRKYHETELFIEAPYRNKALYDALLQTLSPHTLLSLAVEVNTPHEWIKTLTIAEWKRQPAPTIQKRNTIFSFLGK